MKINYRGPGFSELQMEVELVKRIPRIAPNEFGLLVPRGRRTAHGYKHAVVAPWGDVAAGIIEAARHSGTLRRDLLRGLVELEAAEHECSTKHECICGERRLSSFLDPGRGVLVLVLEGEDGEPLSEELQSEIAEDLVDRVLAHEVVEVGDD